MRDWLSPDDFAEQIDVSTKTVVRLCRRGALPAKRFGHQWRVHRRALAAPTEARSTSSTGPAYETK